jgi:hypothetical protein
MLTEYNSLEAYITLAIFSCSIRNYTRISYIAFYLVTYYFSNLFNRMQGTSDEIG